MVLQVKTGKMAVILTAGAAIFVTASSYYQYKCNPEKDSERRTVEITYSCTVSDIANVVSGVKAWVPVPATNSVQELLSKEVQGDWPYSILDESEHRNRFLVLDLSSAAGGDAVYACDIRRGNCSDFHSLFIAEARSLGIPACFIMGLPLPDDKSEGTIGGYHCWAEFYLSGRGWIPIDASEAFKHPRKRERFFGGLDEHRIALSLGRDIKLPGSASKPINYAFYPHVEVDGSVHDNVSAAFAFKDIN